MDLHQVRPHKYLIFLVAAFIACYLTQEMLLNRLTSIGTGYITGGTFIYFTSSLILDIVAEVYGYKIAQQLLFCGLGALLFAALGDSLTVILSTLGAFWGRIPVDRFMQNLIPELIIMVSFTAVGAIPAAFLANLLKRVEYLEESATSVSYNPFKFAG